MTELLHNLLYLRLIGGLLSIEINGYRAKPPEFWHL